MIFKVKQRPHQTFARKGSDLYISRTIQLIDALTGFEFDLTHLDGEVVTIKSDEIGKIIANGDKKIIKGKGLPRETGGRGNLYVEFKLEMPKSSFVKDVDELEVYSYI